MRSRWASIKLSTALIALVLVIVALSWRAWRAYGITDDEDAGGVRDTAELMTEEQRTRVAAYHAYLLLDHDIDYRVQTTNDSADINTLAVRLFDELRVAEESASGRGLLLLIDPRQDLVRLEVGQSLEGVFPDAFIAYVQHRQMVPFFRTGRVADGILATTELIVTRVQNAKANAGYENESWAAGTAGGGATTKAKLAAGSDESYRSGGAVAAQASPEATLAEYFRSMRTRNANPNSGIYTVQTRKMLQNWLVTPAQMDNVIRTYRQCAAEPVRYDRSGSYAVIRYPVKDRQCSPWFFEFEDGRWRLDLTMMQKAIRFGRSNAWRFEQSVQHPYLFAFKDWTLDAHGFPR